MFKVIPKKKMELDHIEFTYSPLLKPVTVPQMIKNVTKPIIGMYKSGACRSKRGVAAEFGSEPPPKS